MANDTHTSILRRMTSPQTDEVAQSPLTTSRAVRMAMRKAAHETLGLVVSVTEVEETVQPLDDMLAGLADELMMVALRRQSRDVGLIALDMQMRAAVVELQTAGQVSERAPDIRVATSTDKQMNDPLLQAFLQDLSLSVAGTEFEGWLDGLSHHDIVRDIRAAALLLEDRDYRILRMNVDLGVEGRAGSVVIALPLSSVVVPPEAPIPAKVAWNPAFHQSVSIAPSVFDVELHRFRISLAEAEALQVGQVLPLPGCTVSSARLVALDGKVTLPAKLGQIGGKRAVRIEQAPSETMADLAAIPADAPMQAAPPIDVPMPQIDMEEPQFDAPEPLIANPMEPAPGELEEIAMDIDIAMPEPMSFDLPD